MVLKIYDLEGQSTEQLYPSATIFSMLETLGRCGETDIHREGAGGNCIWKDREL